MRRVLYLGVGLVVGSLIAAGGEYRKLEAAPADVERALVSRVAVLSAMVDDLTERLSHLESSLARGSTALLQSGRVVAPFEVVDKSGNPILTVADAPHAAASKGRVQIARGSGSNYVLSVRRANGEIVATIAEDKAGEGLITVRDRTGVLRADMWGANGVNVYSGVTPVASLVSDVEAGGAGAVRVMNTKGQVNAGLLGDLRGGGAVAVANSSGNVVSELSTSAEGFGHVQVFFPGGRPAAVMSQDANGGVLQINNGAGVNIVNLQTAASGGGYLQMTDKGGKTLLEAGISGMGVGMVRVGPTSVCGPSVAATFGLSSCLMGLPGR